MSEYIIEWSGIGGQLARLLNDNVPLVLWPKKIREERQREEVVRCRDCKHYKPWVLSRPENGGDCVLNKVEVDVWFDGFCAWGTRRGE